MISTPSSHDSPHRDSFTSSRTRWQKLRRLDPGDLLLGGSAVLALPLARLALDRWGLQACQRVLARTFRRRSSPLPPGRALDRAHRMAWVVEVAARRGLYRPNCLQRSLTLWWFLGLRGVEGEIRIGVRRKPDSQVGTRGLDFHAWVEHAGVVLNDAPDVRRRFTTFSRAIAPTDARWR